MQESIQQSVQQAAAGRSVPENFATYHGTTHKVYGLKVPEKRKLAKQWAKENKDIMYDDWLVVMNSLYTGESYEEKTIAGHLLESFHAHRKQLNLDQLRVWLGELTGWAEVDHTCQSAFTANEMLHRWPEWELFLLSLATDEHISRRRASLVLLTNALRSQGDSRLLEVGLANVDTLKHETSPLITKAISWVLRSAIDHHREDVEQFLQANEDELPRIAVREFKKKATTGHK